MTYKSFDGFQSVSNKIILLAPIKFSPVPPALAHNKKTLILEFGSLNLSTRFYLFLYCFNKIFNKNPIKIKKLNFLIILFKIFLI